MPETPQEWYDRTAATLAQEGYRDEELSQWSTWPWTGELRAKPLDPPAESEPARRGAGGADCRSCDVGVELPAEVVAWHDELFVLTIPHESRACPFALFLSPRRHADLQDLAPAEASRQGELLSAVEQAACAVLAVPRIQVARWGDGGEHLHWWLYARPTGMLQLRGTFLSHWDDLLPPVPRDAFVADQRLVARALVARVGGVAPQG